MKQQKSGADCAKFQVIFADEICTPITNTTICSSLLEMPDHDWLRIADLSRKLGIRLILDVFGDCSLQSALLLKVNRMHATDVTNIPLLTLVSDAHFDHVYGYRRVNDGRN